MKYLKSFIESVKDDPLASLKSCFDGFEEFGATLYSHIEYGEKSVGIVWNNLYKIDYGILDELESSFGKAKELGFKFYSAYIDIGSNGVRDERMHFKEDEDLTKILGKEVSFISVYFDNRYYQNIEEETITENFKKFENVLEGDVTNCFDHIENLRVIKMLSSSKVFNRIRLISKEKEWLYNGYTTDQNLIDDIIAGIGMAEEIGFQFIKIYFQPSTGGKEIEISKLYLLENPKGRLKKIKKFPVSSIIIDFGLAPKKKVLENINQHNVGRHDTELKHCFDGFEELNLHCQELSGNGLYSILMSRRHEKFTAVPFIIDEDIIDEMESSIGKAIELGHSLKKINISAASLKKDEFYSALTKLEQFKNFNGIRTNNILIRFNKPINENISLEPSIKNTFDNFEDQGYKVFKAELNVSNRTIERDLPGFISTINGNNIHPLAEKSKVYLVGISNRSELDVSGQYPIETVEINEDLIEDIESAIGMAKEIGYQFVKLDLRFKLENSVIETIKILKINDLYKYLGRKSNVFVVSFVKIT